MAFFINNLSHPLTVYIVLMDNLNPFPNDKFLDSSKLKDFADDNLTSNENGRNAHKRVENNVGKGEIVRYEQFLLFPHCFQETNTANL